MTDEYGPNPPLPPHASNLSASSYKLISGGSFSSPAAHYCPVCGIIATSEANLEVMLHFGAMRINSKEIHFRPYCLHTVRARETDKASLCKTISEHVCE